MQFAGDELDCSVRCPQRRIMRRMRCRQGTLQLPHFVAALHRAGNVNVDVAGKTPLSDWR